MYTITAAEQPSSPTISVYDIHFHLSDGTYRGTARLQRRQLKFHSLFTFSYLVLFVYFVGKYQQLAPKKEETSSRDCKVTHAKWLMMPLRVERMQRIVIHHYNMLIDCYVRLVIIKLKTHRDHRLSHLLRIASWGLYIVI